MPESLGSAEGVYLAAHLQETLANDPRVNAPELRVSCGPDGIITVSGVVPTAQRRDAVVEVIHETDPEVQVRNDTTVLDLTASSSPEALT